MLPLTAEEWQRVSIAPMMEITDRRFRYFIRLLNPHVRLYTEMVVAHAIVKGDRNRLLAFDAKEHPVVLQLGGDDPLLLAEAASIAADFGYDAIDINCGCPSERVESGNFGVTLMRKNELVRQIIEKISQKVELPVSIKCRIGITGEESEEKLEKFAQDIFSAGAASLTVHARTATLGGLSPKENRSIPPLRYDWVYRLKEKFPEKTIELNGGVRDTPAIREHLSRVDRVMLGRLAQENPCFFAIENLDSMGERLAILSQMAEYAAQWEKSPITAARFFTNMLNVFHGLPGSRAARRFLSEEGRTLSPASAVEKLKERAL